MDITSANSTFVISSADIALAATALEGYWVDSGFTFEDSEIAVAQVGVDGKMSAGWVPRLVPITVTLSPDSPSVVVMDTIITTADMLRAPVILNGVITIPSINKSYTLGRGVLTRVKMAPNAERILGSQSFVITFESCKPAAI